MDKSNATIAGLERRWQSAGKQRERAIKGLEKCLERGFDCSINGNECPYYAVRSNYSRSGDCIDNLMTDALSLLKSMYTPREVRNALIEHGQHDLTIRLGEVIKYDPVEVENILTKEKEAKIDA